MQPTFKNFYHFFKIIIMKLKKINRIGSKIQERNVINILKTFLSVMLITIAVFFTTSIFAQNNKDTAKSNSSSSGDDTFNQMLDYSRPGKYHQLLADLVGTWAFKGRHFDWVDSVTSKVALEFSGTSVRKSFANGRYFIVDVTSDSTLEMPIQDGKMKTVKFQGIDIEGYDNVKKKFVRTSIGNHLYSGIHVPEGVYDSATKTITFDSEFESAPGTKTKDHLLFIFLDNDHYKWEYYQEYNGKYYLVTEINFARIIGK
jgi:hypothetical protein